MILEAALMGLLGGTARAAVGLLKAMRTNVKILWPYALLTICCSAIVGVTAGIIFDSDLKISLIAGYAGTDLLENVYKIIFRRLII